MVYASLQRGFESASKLVKVSHKNAYSNFDKTGNKLLKIMRTVWFTKEKRVIPFCLFRSDFCFFIVNTRHSASQHGPTVLGLRAGDSTKCCTSSRFRVHCSFVLREGVCVGGGGGGGEGVGGQREGGGGGVVVNVM